MQYICNKCGKTEDVKPIKRNANVVVCGSSIIKRRHSALIRLISHAGICSDTDISCQLKAIHGKISLSAKV